jgi:hypothetical protein
MVEHICNPSYSGEGDWRIESSRPTQVKLVRPYLQNNKNTKRFFKKRTGGIAQVVEH